MLLKQADTTNPNSWSSRFRRKRAKRIKELIIIHWIIFGRVKIIDLGGREDYWINSIGLGWLESHSVHITIINTEILTEQIGQTFTILHGDATNLNNFSGKVFNIAHSNSVLEHVGSLSNMCKMIFEMERVADNVYLQTPNYWFPIDPHYLYPFVHWLPGRILNFIRSRFTLGQVKKGSDKKIITVGKTMVKAMFPHAKYYPERFLGLTKSHILIK